MKKYIVLGLIAVILFPIVLKLFLIPNVCITDLSTDGWAGFLGGYIGGMATLFAVFLTIDHNNKIFQKQKDNEKKKEEEKTRLSIMPYIQSSYNYFGENDEMSDHDILLLLDEENIRYSFNNHDKMLLKQKNSDYCFLKYKIRNVGAGGAIEMKISINGKDFGAKYALPVGESISLFLRKYMGEDKSCSIKIIIDYWDVILQGHYYIREKIDININNGEIETITDTLDSIGHTRLD